MRTLAIATVALSFIGAAAIGTTAPVWAQGVYVDVPGVFMLAWAVVRTTTGTIITIMLAAHITAVGPVGLFRAATAHPTMGTEALVPARDGIAKGV
jgi:hypothetical protein